MKRELLRMCGVLAVLVLFLSGCAGFRQSGIRTQSVRPEEVTGTYTLILHGAQHIEDIKTVAFLDREGDQYTLQPYTPEFEYTVRRGVPAQEALARAQRFVSWHSDFSRAQLSRIVDRTGAVIGYEMRPLYMPFTFGHTDILDIDYWTRGSTVNISVRLIPSVERIREGGGLFIDIGD
ncbi:MAG: hypothetical protein AB1805_13475 [Nitrospirota bacterium]